MRWAMSMSTTVPPETGRTTRMYVGRAARHLLGEGADGDERAGTGVHGGDTGLVDDEARALDVHAGPRGPEVDGDVAAAQLLQTDGHGRSSREALAGAPAAAGSPGIVPPGEGRRALGEP